MTRRVPARLRSLEITTSYGEASLTGPAYFPPELVVVPRTVGYLMPS